MIFTIPFKTPDAISDTVTELENEGFSEDEAAAAEAVAKKFIKNGECVTLEFDTETGEAKVLLA